MTKFTYHLAACICWQLLWWYVFLYKSTLIYQHISNVSMEPFIILFVLLLACMMHALVFIGYSGAWENCRKMCGVEHCSGTPSQHHNPCCLITLNNKYCWGWSFMKYCQKSKDWMCFIADHPMWLVGKLRDKKKKVRKLHPLETLNGSSGAQKVLLLINTWAFDQWC